MEKGDKRHPACSLSCTSTLAARKEGQMWSKEKAQGINEGLDAEIPQSRTSVTVFG